ncbi:MAG: IclR family transcriptional regulator [Burkholderiales bacterium]|nr:IclR family transcriptional regulator [Burkholderiales bacterium]
MSLLQAFNPGDDLLTNAEIAVRARLPKATITRLTYTLCKLGYLARDPAGGGYRLDPHILTLGYPVLARLGMRQLARPLMQALAEAEGLTVSMGLRDGAHMIFVERVRSSAPVVLQQDIGTRVPIATTALGRGYLAGLAPADREALMSEVHAQTPEARWNLVRKGVDREMERFARKGWCFGGDWDAALTGVAVPLVLPGRGVLSISCAGARTQLPEARLAAIGVKLKDIARRVALAQDTAL